MISIIIVLLAVGIGLFLWLRSREQGRAAAGQPRLATWRVLLAAFAALVMLFSGGCSLLFMPAAVRGDQYVGFSAILVMGGIPFAIALLVWWLSMRRPRA